MFVNVFIFRGTCATERLPYATASVQSKYICVYVCRIVVRIMRSDSRDIVASKWLRESNLLARAKGL